MIALRAQVMTPHAHKRIALSSILWEGENTLSLTLNSDCGGKWFVNEFSTSYKIISCPLALGASQR